MCAEIVITRKLKISRNLISYQAQHATVGRQKSRHSRLPWDQSGVDRRTGSVPRRSNLLFGVQLCPPVSRHFNSLSRRSARNPRAGQHSTSVQ